MADTTLKFRPPGQLNVGDKATTDDWRKWLQSYRWYAGALHINDKSHQEQLAAFKSIIGPEALEVYNTFSISDTLDVESVIQRFEEHFIPKGTNLKIERLKFNRLNQKQGQSFEEFLAKVVEQADKCHFGPMRDDLLLDRIVAGIADDQIRDALLADDNLTYNKAVEICKASAKIHFMSRIDISQKRKDQKQNSFKKDQKQNSTSKKDHNNVLKKDVKQDVSKKDHKSNNLKKGSKQSPLVKEHKISKTAKKEHKSNHSKKDKRSSGLSKKDDSSLSKKVQEEKIVKKKDPVSDIFTKKDHLLKGVKNGTLPDEPTLDDILQEAADKEGEVVAKPEQSDLLQDDDGHSYSPLLDDGRSYSPLQDDHARSCSPADDQNSIQEDQKPDDASKTSQIRVRRVSEIVKSVPFPKIKIINAGGSNASIASSSKTKKVKDDEDSYKEESEVESEGKLASEIYYQSMDSSSPAVE